MVRKISNLREHCGIIGIYSFDHDEDISSDLFIGLEALQHRGQESWGIVVHDHEPYKRMGLVSQNENEYEKIKKIKGNIGIGHVRYSTIGRTTIGNAHPIKIDSSLYIAHNGTLEREPLIEYLREKGNSPSEQMTDTKLLGLGISKLRKEGKDWVEAFEILNEKLNGSFSLIMLTNEGELIVARDERGFRPLCLGWKEDNSSYVVVSESCALDTIKAKILRDVEPGEIIKIDKNGLEKYKFSEKKHAHCPFEYTYFAHPTSVIEGQNVYYARKEIGKELFKKYPLDGDVVIPVPDSARPSALGYSEVSGIPFEEGLMKDRYRKKGSLRSFIEPEKREEIVSNIIPIRQIIEGKHVILIDDSIVRGTSSKTIVWDKLRDAKSVSLLLDFPPILYPCYMGIDFPTQDELSAFKFSSSSKSLEKINEKVREELGVKFVGYNDVDGLSRGIGLPKEELCLACTTGNYSCLKYPPKFKTRREMKS